MKPEAMTALNKLAYAWSDDHPDDSDLELSMPDCDCDEHSQCCLEGDLPGELYAVDEPGLTVLVEAGLAEDRGDHYQVAPGAIFRITAAGRAAHQSLVENGKIRPLSHF